MLLACADFVNKCCFTATINRVYKWKIFCNEVELHLSFSNFNLGELENGHCLYDMSNISSWCLLLNIWISKTSRLVDIIDWFKRSSTWLLLIPYFGCSTLWPSVVFGNILRISNQIFRWHGLPVLKKAREYNGQNRITSLNESSVNLKSFCLFVCHGKWLSLITSWGLDYGHQIFCDY